MMNFKFTKILLIIVFLFALAISVPSTASAAPRLYFDPNPQTLSKGQETNVYLKIDAESTQIFGTDAIITYPGSDIEILSVTNGGFFSDLSFASSTSGALEIHAFFSSLFQTKSGSGIVATIKIRANKNQGSGLLGFTCSGDGTDTQILDNNGDNILSCGSLIGEVLNFATVDTGGNNGDTEPNYCGGTCGSNINCQTDFFCYQGFCRNASCSEKTDCICSADSTTAPITQIFKSQNPVNSTTSNAIVLDDYEPEEKLASSPEAQEDGTAESPDYTTALIGLGIFAGLVIIFFIVKMILSKRKPPTPPPTSTISHPIDPPLSSNQSGPGNL